MAESGVAPAIAGYHHFSPTVSDVEASAQWYERVFGMTRVPVAFPHHGAEQGGYAVVLTEPRSGIALGLHHHEANPGQSFDERRVERRIAERDVAQFDMPGKFRLTADLDHQRP